MNIMNWIVQWTLRKEAKKIVKQVNKMYPQTKARMPDAPEQEVIKSMGFDDKKLEGASSEVKNRINICCKTLNGFCYMMVLDVGSLKGWMNLRSLQFTKYVDNELLKAGYIKQTLEQKEEILKVMNLAIDNWRRITGD